MGFGISSIFDISLERANQFYTWGWRGSIAGALITALAVCFLMWGTRVRDRDFDSKMGTLYLEASQSRERAGELEKRAAELENEAAQARAETERIKGQLAWRRVSKVQHDAIVARLFGKSITFSSFAWTGMDTEAGLFAGELWRTLSDAGVKLNLNLPSPPLSGLGVVVSDAGETPAFLDVTAALSAAGIPFVHGSDTPHLQIFVGSKPPGF
jgi:hypothetical protein